MIRQVSVHAAILTAGLEANHGIRIRTCDAWSSPFKSEQVKQLEQSPNQPDKILLKSYRSSTEANADKYAFEPFRKAIKNERNHGFISHSADFFLTVLGILERARFLHAKAYDPLQEKLPAKDSLSDNWGRR
jgi:hypothetical protein